MMIEFVNSVKKTLHDKYGVLKTGGTQDAPILLEANDGLLDGIYPMDIDGKKYRILIKDNKLSDIGKVSDTVFSAVVAATTTVLDSKLSPQVISTDIYTKVNVSLGQLEAIVTSVTNNTWISVGESLPDNEIFVFVKKDGKIYNEAIYRVDNDWFTWSGHKLTKLFAKQFHHWKYQHLM